MVIGCCFCWIFSNYLLYTTMYSISLYYGSYIGYRLLQSYTMSYEDVCLLCAAACWTPRIAPICLCWCRLFLQTIKQSQNLSCCGKLSQSLRHGLDGAGPSGKKREYV